MDNVRYTFKVQIPPEMLGKIIFSEKKLALRLFLLKW